MSDMQIAAQQLAQAIARFRLAERDATRALVIADCTLKNVSTRYRLYQL